METNPTETIELPKQPSIPETGFNFNSSFQTDPKQEVEGSWTVITADGKDLHILIARSDNKKAANYLRTRVKANERALKADDRHATELFEEIQIDVMSKFVLLGWKDLFVDGVKRSYSPELAKTLLSFKDFYNAVDAISKDFTVFKSQEMDSILKNS